MCGDLYFFKGYKDLVSVFFMYFFYRNVYKDFMKLLGIYAIVIASRETLRTVQYTLQSKFYISTDYNLYVYCKYVVQSHFIINIYFGLDMRFSIQTE